MKAAILGAGGIGLGTAVLLSSKAIEVSIWGASAQGIGPLLSHSSILSRGALDGKFHAAASHDLREVVDQADLIILTVPGDAQRSVIDLLVPHVQPNQLIAISSQLSFSALYLSRQLAQRGSLAPISAWATTAVTARRIGPAEVSVSAIRGHVVNSTFDPECGSRADAALAKAFGPVFAAAPDLMTATLSNVNPTAHVAMALCNLTRMERGEEWGSYYGISGAVGRLIEAMDAERLRLASWFGLSVHPLQEHWHRSFKLPIGTVSDMAAEQHVRKGGVPLGPARLEHRYVTEDVPFGIVPLLALGRVAGVEMPLHEAGLKIVNALYGRDFAAENDLLDRLGIEAKPPEALLALCRSGYRPDLVSGVAANPNATRRQSADAA